MPTLVLSRGKERIMKYYSLKLYLKRTHISDLILVSFITFLVLILALTSNPIFASNIDSGVEKRSPAEAGMTMSGTIRVTSQGGVGDHIAVVKLYANPDDPLPIETKTLEPLQTIEFTDLPLSESYTLVSEPIADGGTTLYPAFYPSNPFRVTDNTAKTSNLYFSEYTGSVKILTPEEPPFPEAPESVTVHLIDHSGYANTRSVTLRWGDYQQLDGLFSMYSYYFTGDALYDSKDHPHTATFTPTYIAHVIPGETVDVHLSYEGFRYQITGAFDNLLHQKTEDPEYRHQPQDIHPYLQTHLNYNFAVFGYESKEISLSGEPRLTGNYQVYPVIRADFESWDNHGTEEDSFYEQIATLKNPELGGNPDLKAILAIGGRAFNHSEHEIGEMTHDLTREMINRVHDSDAHERFIGFAIEYARRYEFDGIEFAWTYPGVRENGENCGTNSEMDRYYEQFLEAFRHSIITESIYSNKPPLLLTIVGPPTVPENVCPDYAVPLRYFESYAQWSEYVDWISVNTDSYATPYNRSTTQAHSPLKDSGNPNIEQTLLYYTNIGISKDKIILNFPAYGTRYANIENLTDNDHGPGKIFHEMGEPEEHTKLAGFLAYYEMLERIATGYYGYSYDTIYTQTPYLYSYQAAPLEKNEWISFDNELSINAKTGLVTGTDGLYGRPLRGGGLISLGLDDWKNGYPLLMQINRSLNDQAPHPTYMRFINSGDTVKDSNITFSVDFLNGSSPLIIGPLYPTGSEILQDQIPYQHGRIEVTLNQDPKKFCTLDEDFNTSACWEIDGWYRATENKYYCQIKKINCP